MSEPRSGAVPRRTFLAGLAGAATVACTPRTSGTTTPATSGAAPTATTAATSSSAPPTTSTPSPTPTPTTSSAAPRSGVAGLRGVLSGRVVLPGEAGYSTATRIFNPRFDGAKPVAVAYCATVDDVRRCVDAARNDGVTPIARAGGHSYGGYSTGNGLLIDVTGIRDVSLAGDVATVGGGARLFDVYATLGRQGRGIPAGSCPTVGMAGLALGGGLGIEGREHGLTSDRMLSVDVVLASGDLVTASENAEPDLFWASRGGGGGNFGIATGFRFATHATADFTRWQLKWSWDHATDVLLAWTAWVSGSPRELFSAINCSSTVGVPRPSVGVFGVLRGTPSRAQSLMDDLARAVGAAPTSTYRRTSSHDDTVRQLAGCSTLTDQQCGRYGDAGGAVPRQAYAAGSDMLRAPLDAAGAAAVVAAIDDRQPRGLATGTVLLDSVGGAIDDVAASATAYVHRGAIASLQYIANWNAGDRPSVIAANLDWFAATKSRMAPHVSGESYQNYIDPGRTDWAKAYYGANYSRLAAVKASYDPDGLFRFVQGVTATGAPTTG